jgi:thiol-disulfide isomerase/thioredoxin
MIHSVLMLLRENLNFSSKLSTMFFSTMKALLLFFFCILSSGNINAHTSNQGLIQFEQMDLTQAQLSGKKIMVSFSADWCLPCKMLESTLYNDEEIASLVNPNFQPVLIDIDSPLAETWKQYFQIEYLPSILFISGSGMEYERITKAPTRAELIKTLKKVIGAEHMAYIPDDHIETTLAQDNQKKISTCIQLGAFSSAEAAHRRKKELSVVAGQHLIIEEHTNGRLLYKVVLRQYFTDEDLQAKLEEYINLGFEAFYRHS